MFVDCYLGHSWDGLLLYPEIFLLSDAIKISSQFKITLASPTDESALLMRLQENVNG